MSVFASVEADIATLPEASRDSWRVEVARALAKEMDEKPNASFARELRAVMKELRADVPVAKGDVSDDLKSRRAARLAASGS